MEKKDTGKRWGNNFPLNHFLFQVFMLAYDYMCIQMPLW